MTANISFTMTDKELLQAILDLLNETGPETPEEVSQTLREAGYNPEDTGKEMKLFASQAWANSPFNWRNKAQVDIANAKLRLSQSTKSIPQLLA